MGLSAPVMADWCISAETDSCLPTSISESFQDGPSFSKIIGKWSLPQGSGPTFLKKSRNIDGLQRVKSIDMKVPLAEYMCSICY